MADGQDQGASNGQANGQSSSSQGSQSNSGANGAQSGNSSSQATQNSNGQGSQSQIPARPGYVPEAHWDATAGKIKDEPAFTKFVNDHVAFKAAEDSRRLTLPQKPEDYKLALPKDFKAPDGIEFVPDENDPLLPQARAFAKEAGLTQDQFEKLVSLHAASQIGNQQMIKEAKAQEVQKLGVNGTARMTAAQTWLNAQVGEDLGKHFGQFLYTAKQVEAVEKLMANFRTQGSGGYTPQHQDHQPPGKIDDATWEKMSFSEKREYAAKHQQPTQQANGRA